MRDTNLGKQLVDARIVFSCEELDKQIEAWAWNDKIILSHLSEVTISGEGSKVYYVNTYYIRADKPPDSSAKLVKITHLVESGSKLIREAFVGMGHYEIKKRELQQPEDGGEENEARFMWFRKVCDLFEVKM
jgi:predicted type IV restriction endonuclease